jgi:arylsulfatase A-like enzyme
MDLFVNGLEKNDRVGNRALAELEKRKDHRFFFFIHFAEPDHLGHRYGENSQEYTDGIKSDDEWTGRIIAKLKELGIYDRTLIYITADHGFNEGERGHGYAPYVFLATNDRGVNRNGNRMDIAPTILKRFGVDLSTCQPALDGVPLDQPAPERKAPAQPPAGKAKKEAVGGPA